MKKFLLLSMFCSAVAHSYLSPISGGAASGPAGGDLAGTYPDPTLSVDRVRKTGDTMSGTLELTNVTPLKLNSSGVTASRVLLIDGSKNASTGTVDGSELGQIDGVTSALTVVNGVTTNLSVVNGVTAAIQTQVNALIGGAGAGATAVQRAGDTMSGTLEITAAAPVKLNNASITADRVVLTDGSKNVTTSSGVDSTELGRLDGVTSALTVVNGVTTNLSVVNAVTSAIQTQLDAKLATATAATTYVAKAGDTMTGPLTGTTIMVGAGAQTDPSVSFTGDPDTGLYNPTANTLGFTAGGARKARITTTGLGIGIDTPLTNLDISTDFSDRLSSVTSVGSITALVTTNSSVRLTGATGVTVSGAASPTAGKFLIVHNNLGSGTATFLNENAASMTSQRFTLSGARDADLPANAAFMFQYDDTSSRWHQVGGANDKVFRAGDTMTGTLTGTTVLLGAGSASAPSHSFTGDPDTGFYNTSANSLSFANGGAESWRMVGDGSFLGVPVGTVVFHGTTTANGADNSSLEIFAGSGNSVARSAGIQIYGNQHGGAPGKLVLAAGTTAEAASASIDFYSGAGVNSGTWDPSGNFVHKNAIADQSFQILAPTEAGTVTISNNVSSVAVLPAAPRTAATLNMPATVINGQIVRIGCNTNAITTLTHSGNGNTILHPLAACVAGTGGTWIFRTADTTWYRLN